MSRVTHGCFLAVPVPTSAGTGSRGYGYGWTQIYPWVTCDEPYVRNSSAEYFHGHNFIDDRSCLHVENTADQIWSIVSSLPRKQSLLNFLPLRIHSDCNK